jgi:hypothetical protein
VITDNTNRHGAWPKTAKHIHPRTRRAVAAVGSPETKTAAAQALGGAVNAALLWKSGTGALSRNVSSLYQASLSKYPRLAKVRSVTGLYRSSSTTGRGLGLRQ